MNRANIVASIRRRLGEDIDDYWTVTDIHREINQAITQFAQEERWPWLYSVKTATLGADADTFDLDDDIDFSRAFIITITKGDEQPSPLRRVSPVEGERLAANRHTTKSRPRYFYIISATQTANKIVYTVRVVPKTDAIYDLRYLFLRNPKQLAGDTDVPDIPLPYMEAIPALATARLWMQERQGHEVKLGEQMTIYMDVVEKARQDMFRLHEDEELVLGRAQDEEERRGDAIGSFKLPPNYGFPGWFD